METRRFKQDSEHQWLLLAMERRRQLHGNDGTILRRDRHDHHNCRQLLSGTLASIGSYGTPVTITAMVVPTSGTLPTVGSVDFQDGGTDLGVISTHTGTSGKAIFTLITTFNQLQVIQANGGVHTISATYLPAPAISAGAGTLAGGLVVTPISLGIAANGWSSAAPNASSYARRNGNIAKKWSSAGPGRLQWH